MVRLTTEQFIEKANAVYGEGTYDFANTFYVNSRTKISIICPIHGEFTTMPSDFLRGHGCPRCGGTGKLSTEEFCRRSAEKYNNKYDTSHVEYINSETPVRLVCPEHGDFWVKPVVHLYHYSGCPGCCRYKKRTTESLIEEFREVRTDRNDDYSKVVFSKMNEKVCIICPEHGEYWITPDKYLRENQACPKCAVERRRLQRFLNRDEVIDRFREVHGDTYIYDEFEYTSMQDKGKIICPKHGPFWQRAYDHVNGHGCPVCGALMSKSEEVLYVFISSLVGEENVIRNDRSVLNGKEIDVYIPSMNIGFEYDGVKWHSEAYGKGRFYHLDKTEEALKKNIRLIHIFEDEWVYRREIVKSKIMHILGCDNDNARIMARKCTCNEIDRKNASGFLEKYHIQGYGKCTVNIGCLYNNNLIGVMSFLREGDGKWNLVRFATDTHYICQGVGGKLFKYFLRVYNPDTVKTFADRRWTVLPSDNLYTKMGFILDSVVKPDYRYVLGDEKHERIHKFNFRKKLLCKRYGFSEDMTESEMAKELGAHKIWDCGLYRYVWKRMA